MGDCLPKCPTGAISFEQREAAEYDRAAVEKNMRKKMTGACPGSKIRAISRNEETESKSNWPVQIKLAPLQAPYFNKAKLLIAADCTAYACANFHEDFIKGKVAIIGCPKLDDIDYSEKLTQIIKNNDIQSVTIVRMAAQKAIKNSGKFLPWKIVTIGIEGDIVEDI